MSCYRIHSFVWNHSRYIASKFPPWVPTTTWFWHLLTLLGKWSETRPQTTQGISVLRLLSGAPWRVQGWWNDGGTTMSHGLNETPQKRGWWCLMSPEPTAFWELYIVVGTQVFSWSNQQNWRRFQYDRNPEISKINPAPQNIPISTRELTFREGFRLSILAGPSLTQGATTTCFHGNNILPLSLNKSQKCGTWKSCPWLSIHAAKKTAYIIFLQDLRHCFSFSTSGRPCEKKQKTWPNKIRGETERAAPSNLTWTPRQCLKLKRIWTQSLA